MLRIISLIFMITYISLNFAHASQTSDTNVDELLRSPIKLKQTISKNALIEDEALSVTSATNVPISVEVLTNHGKDPIKSLNHSVPAGTYTLKAVLDDIVNQDSSATWEIVDKSVFIVIKTQQKLDDPLDTKLTITYDGDMTLEDWIDWLYHQAPLSGLDLESPDASRDTNKILYHVKKGATVKSVLAALGEKNGGSWLFRIEKNNHIIGGPKPLDSDQLPPLTDAQRKYLDEPAVGNQLGRTQVYYYPR